ncbi:MAG: glycosyltransferase family 2 protein, partial [Vicinamibacterales bacterium]
MPETRSRSEPRGTLLIVGYRAYDELALCLGSIAHHEPHARVVLVDHEADEARGRRLTEPYPNVHYVPAPDNPGFAAGVNRAARLAEPGPLLVLNPDCLLQGPVRALLVEVLDRFPDVGVVGGLIHEPDGRVQPSARRFPDITTAFGGRTSWLSRVAPRNPLTRRNLQGDPACGPTRVDWVIGAYMLIRREVFDQLNGFDESFFLYWEDADFCRRARDRGWQTVFAPVAAVTHLTARTSRHARLRSLIAFHTSALR